MTIEYRFALDDHEPELHYIIATDASEQGNLQPTAPAKWTRLKNNQCVNCPLDAKKHEFCPAAVDIQNVVEDVGALPAIKKARVRVIAPEREYAKQTSLEEGVRSLMGLLMANSACPILNKLKPMALTHLPFASQREFILRSVSTYLLRQYFLVGDKTKGDWSLRGLIELNKQLQLVNQAMWQRVNSAHQGEANLKALLSFFSMAASVSYSLETQLQKIKPEFLAESNLGSFDL
ncbi:DUF6901 family protein [Salinispirillum marinum]|uniref:DUF6901 family protein n=2 Tax=Saccharospirillaceae TaxID=255527 RepID=A0ABV8BHS9_9GAMM